MLATQHKSVSIDSTKANSQENVNWQSCDISATSTKENVCLSYNH